MQAPTIDHLAQQFVDSWKQVFSQLPRYHLDGSWPSIGILDRLIHPFRFRGSIDPADENLLQGAAAYIARLVIQAWTEFSPEVDVLGKVHVYPKFEIVVTASGGELLGGGGCSVEIYSELKKFLSALPGPVGVFGSVQRVLPKDGNALSSFVLGILAARRPMVTGSWADATEGALGPYLIRLVHYLSESSAGYFSQTYPLATHSANPKLYHHQLILPPLGYSEPCLGAQATSGLIKYFNDEAVEQNERIATALELANSPDETLSIAGFSVACALSPTIPPARLALLAQSLGAAVHPLRPATVLARYLLGQSGDWFQLLTTEQYERADALLNFERSLGMLPLLQLASVYICRPQLQPFFEFVARGEIAGAKNILEFYCSIYQSEKTVQLQLAYLSLLSGDLDHAEHVMRTLQLGDFSTAYDRFSFLANRARICDRRFDTQMAVTYWQQALSYDSPFPCDYDDAVSSLGAAYVLNSHFDKGLALADSLLAKLPNRSSLRVLRALCFASMFQEEDARIELNELYETVPFKYSVFTLLQGTYVQQTLAELSTSDDS